MWLNGYELWLNAFQKHTKKNKPLRNQKLCILQNNCFLLLLIVVELFWIVLECSSKAQTKQTFTNSKKTVFKIVAFFLKPFQKIAKKKKVHKGYPLAGSCICNYKLKWTFSMNNNLFGSHVFFLLVLFTFNCGWMALNCDSMLFKNTNLYRLWLRKNKLS